MGIGFKGEFSVKKTVLALGSFDGLHKAHMAIIDKTIEYAKEVDCNSAVLLFDRLPGEIFGQNIQRLMTLNDKKDRLSMLDLVYLCEFSKEFADMEPERFVDFIIEEFDVCAVCAGFNYRFGKNASGNIETLKEEGKKRGFSVIEVPEYKIDGETVSSTKIREFIKNGDIKKANNFLGYDFYMSGNVVGGYHIGRTMGIPTVNLKYDEKCILPAFGVYAGYVLVDGKSFMAVTNVGKRPTFEREDITVESFLIDFEGDLYNKEIKVCFSEYLRDEIKFKNKQELAEQIKKDILSAREILGE